MTHWGLVGRRYEPVDWVKRGINLVLATLAISVAVIIICIVGFLSLILYTPTPAVGHEWYPPLCCSGGDCAPLDPKRVIELTAGGFLIDNRFYVPQKDVGPSLDGRYHACFPKPDDMKCFFAPGRGI